MKKSLISAVKKLLAKLGAEEVEGNNLVEVIDSGADAIEGGGGSGGGGLLICTDTNDTLDKTMGEIQEAFTNGTLVYIKINNKSCIVTSFQNVVYDPADHKYISYLAAFDVTQQSRWQYKVGETTEEAALAAYPTWD